MTHLKIAPTCFGLRPSSGSLHWSLANAIFRLRFGKNYVVICYTVARQLPAEVLKLVATNTTVFCVVTLNSPVKIYQRFGGTALQLHREERGNGQAGK